MKIIIARHGMTIEKEQGLLQGHIQGRLSAQGLKEVEILADQLKNERLDVIYASDLDRAADTAKAIAKFHPDTPVHFTKELRERHFGIFQGRNKKEVGWAKEALHFRHPEGGESMDAAFRRAQKFLAQICRNYRRQTVLIVAHQDINLCLRAVISRQPIEAIFVMKNRATAVIDSFKITDELAGDLIKNSPLVQGTALSV